MKNQYLNHGRPIFKKASALSSKYICCNPTSRNALFVRPSVEKYCMVNGQMMLVLVCSGRVGPSVGPSMFRSQSIQNYVCQKNFFGFNKLLFA